MRARREQVVLGAAAAAVLVAIVAFAAAGGVKSSAPVPTPPPRPSGDRPLFGGSLDPGVRYRTRAFVPALSFAVADTEWIVNDASQPDRLLLVRRIRTGAPGGELPPRSYLSFSNARLPAAELRDAMKRHPNLVVGRATPVMVGGAPGESFHVGVHFTRPDAACRTLLLVCSAIAPGRYLVEGTQMRTIVLVTEPSALVIDIIGATRRDLEKVEAPATQVLRTLRIGVR